VHQDFEHQLHSEYPIQDRVVGDFDLTPLSQAPLRSLVIAKVKVPQQKAFRLMLSGIHECYPDVEELVWTETDNGRIVAGSVPTGAYKGSSIVEPIRYLQNGSFYVYQIALDATTKFIPIRNHLGVFTVEAISAEESLIVWRQYFDNSIPLTGKLIAWIMQDRTAEPAFARLVEQFGGERIEYW
jgi:hypothetical protein